MTHTANELITSANILDTDGVTALASGVACGVTNLSGRRLDQAQLTNAETTHMVVFRAPDASAMTANGYVLCEGVLYIVDYTMDPRKPRPTVWLEVYCHASRGNA